MERYLNLFVYPERNLCENVDIFEEAENKLERKLGLDHAIWALNQALLFSFFFFWSAGDGFSEICKKRILTHRNVHKKHTIREYYQPSPKNYLVWYLFPFFLSHSISYYKQMYYIILLILLYLMLLGSHIINLVYLFNFIRDIDFLFVSRLQEFGFWSPCPGFPGGLCPDFRSNLYEWRL